MMDEIRYEVNAPLTVGQYEDVLRRSTLAERRPIDDPECLAGMVANSNLLVTAWAGETPVGLARALTDFSYVCYLADLAVDAHFQKKGIGRRLIDLTQEQLGPRCKIILLAAPAASYYYPYIGFEQDRRVWVLPREQRVR